MALKFYDVYMQDVANTPKMKYINDFQEILNQQFYNSSTIWNIEEELEMGSKKFTPIECRVTYAVDISTGTRLSDDFKRLLFKNLKYDTDKGRIYKFDDNYWLCTDTSEIKSLVSSIMVRRCNNLLKWIDKENGEIKSHPCIVDYTNMSPSPSMNGNINTPSSNINVIIQGNKDTHNIYINKRFIISGVPYKFVAWNNYMMNGIIDNRTPLLYMDLQRDEVAPDDDLTNGIANSKEYNYEINILQDDFDQTKDSQIQLDVEVKLNGKIVDRKIGWETLNNNAKVSDVGLVTLVGEVGTQAEIKAYISGNESIYEILKINIEESVPIVRKIIIKPDIKEILQGRIVNFEAYVYQDGIKLNLPIEIEDISDIKSSYEFNLIDGNHFSIKNIKQSYNPVVISFKVDRENLLQGMNTLTLNNIESKTLNNSDWTILEEIRNYRLGGMF